MKLLILHRPAASCRARGPCKINNEFVCSDRLPVVFGVVFCSTGLYLFCHDWCFANLWPCFVNKWNFHKRRTFFSLQTTFWIEHGVLIFKLHAPPRAAGEAAYLTIIILLVRSPFMVWAPSSNGRAANLRFRDVTDPPSHPYVTSRHFGWYTQMTGGLNVTETLSPPPSQGLQRPFRQKKQWIYGWVTFVHWAPSVCLCTN